MAKIKLKGKSHYLGSFDIEEEGALAYDREARQLFGGKAVLNFEPVTGEELLWRDVRRDGGQANRRRPPREAS